MVCENLFDVEYFLFELVGDFVVVCCELYEYECDYVEVECLV